MTMTPSLIDAHWYTPGHHDRDWMAAAACRDHDPQMWFPEQQHDRHHRAATRYTTRRAQQICLECPVIGDCLAYAITTDTRFGIWGGATAHDRAQLTGRRVYG